MRLRVRPAVVALVLAAAVIAPTAAAVAQTTTTTVAPPATTVPTTTPVTTPATTAPSTATTAAGGSTATTGTPESTTTPPVVVQTKDDGGLSIPWIPILVALVVIAAIVTILALVSRKRGAAKQLVTDWRREAADATAEAGATARLLSQGTPPSGQIAQQIVTSLRAFEDLERSAPDDTLADTAERARRALQTLGLAIDSDHRLRRAQPPADTARLAQSQESVQSAAAETDRTLRGVYRMFTSSD